MKFCYIDESGAGNESVAISVGIVVDALRMNRTKSEWASLLQELTRIAQRPVFDKRKVYQVISEKSASRVDD